MPDLESRVHKWVSGFNGFPTDMIATLMQVAPNDWEEVTVPQKDVRYDDFLPMWEVMFKFDFVSDEEWLEECPEAIDIMSKCGFRVYKHDDWGYFFGIDGAGYSFLEEHWIPLYNLRFGGDEQ